MAILPGEASRNDFIDEYIFSWKSSTGVESRSPTLIEGWLASTNGPTWEKICHHNSSTNRDVMILTKSSALGLSFFAASTRLAKNV